MITLCFKTKARLGLPVDVVSTSMRRCTTAYNVVSTLKRRRVSTRILPSIVFETENSHREEKEKIMIER